MLGQFFLVLVIGARLQRMPRGNAAQILQVGLIAIAAANAVSFAISHQAYSDSLIMTLTAFLVGAALAGQRAVGHSPAPPLPGLRPGLPPQPARLGR